MASVYKKQNDEEALKFLYTAKRKYSLLKFLNNIKFCWMVVVVALTITISKSSPNDLLFSLTYREIEIALAAINIFVVVVASPIKMLLNKYQEYIANIQQCFDAYCFNDDDAKVKIIDKDASLSYEQRSSILACNLPEDCSKLINWYKNYSTLSLYEQILHSQRENISWSNKLKFVFLIAHIIMLVICLCFLFPIVKKELDVGVIAILSSCVVFLRYSVNAIFNICYDLYFLRKIKNISNSINEKKIQKTKLISLQKNIYDYRKTNYQVPDLFYEFSRNHMQNFFNRIANVKRQGNV